MVLVSVLSVSLTIVAAEGSTFIVDVSGGGDFNSIQDAISASSNGDIIQINTGVYHENVLVNKKISLIGSNEGSVIIDGDGEGSGILIGVSGVIVEKLTVRNSDMTIDNETRPFDISGIYIEEDDVMIRDCVISNCYYAIFAHTCSNVTIDGCTAIDNHAGFCLNNSLDGEISDCDLLSQENYGIFLQGSRYFIVKDTLINQTSSIGLMVTDSSDNEIYQNNFIGNNYGVRIFASVGGCSDDNFFFRNNFIDNDIDVYDACSNIWYGDMKGNYWDEYTGVDGDGDGIGDEVYPVPLIGEDKYPLMDRFMGNESIVNSLTILSPIDDAVVNGTMLITGTIISDSVLDTLSVRVGDGEWEEFDVDKSFEISLSTWAFDNGNVTIVVRALFADGSNVTDSVEVMVYNEVPSDDSDDQTSGFTLLILVVGVIFFVFHRKRSL